jgi:hypothetical protein
VITYPTVLGECDTLAAVVGGRSIARYGDGEFKMAAHNAGIKSQEPNPDLSKRLREILHDSGECLVGIPNIVDVRKSDLSTDQKVEFWTKHQQYKRLLINREYVSSFITRPDSAPWIDTDDYWAMLCSLWKGQDVMLVRGSGKSLTAERLMEWGARSVIEVMPRLAANGRQQHAWAQYDELLKRIGRPKRALICLGPTATVMAVDLCARGVHAIDLGHAGMFLKKHMAGEPVVVTDEDKAVDQRVPA